MYSDTDNINDFFWGIYACLVAYLCIKSFQKYKSFIEAEQGVFVNQHSIDA